MKCSESTFQIVASNHDLNYNVDGYSKEEGRAYIKWKLKKAGCTDPVFDDVAIEAILNASDGTAHVISKLCNASLVIGHSQSANRITADIVMQAINDSTLGWEDSRN